MQSDALRGLFIHETKIDNINAFIIAEVLRIGRYTNTEILPENIHALRELRRHRFYVVDMESYIKRKVIALLNQVFPEYEKLFTDTFGVTSMQLLANYSTHEQILSVDSQTLADLLQKASRGRFGLDKAYQIQEFAKNSFGIILVSSSISLISKQYIEQLKSFESCIEVFDAEIAKIYDTFDCKLHTITGIGKALAAVIFSEIGGDISKN